MFDEIILLYGNREQDVLQVYQLLSEQAIDATRDLFSAFFEEAYKKLFDGSSLLCPVVHPGMDVSTVGLIISHAYLVTGLLPTRIAFPCLILLGTNVDIPDCLIALWKAVWCGLYLSTNKHSKSLRYSRPQESTPDAHQYIEVRVSSQTCGCLMNIGVPAQHKPFWKSYFLFIACPHP